MKKYNYIASARRTLKIESESISAIGKQLNQSFANLCENVISSKGKFVIMGVGKSGHIAQKISATLTSTGTPSIFIHPTEAAHGDMGLIGKKDIVLLISNSGETDEIINILPSLKRHAKEISSLTSNNNSTIAKSADIKIELKSKKEACPLDLAPTSSTTNALAFGDALAIALLEAKGFTKNDFASSHPAGKLGKKLITQVQDIMHKGSSVPKVTPNTVLDKALIEITKKNLGITLVIDKTKVVGIFTDGDLRRCINKKIDIQKTKIKEVMTKSYKTIKSNALAVDAAQVMEKNKILTLIVVENKKHVGVISMHDLIEARIL
jgi:arabinose-5-phosphate isomerase